MKSRHQFVTIGSLASGFGAFLGSVRRTIAAPRSTISGETASGWQQANFAVPVRILANTVYVGSYFCPQGFYAADQSTNEGGRWLSPGALGEERKIRRPVRPLVSLVAMCTLIFSTCLTVHGKLLNQDVDFSYYDRPLFKQMVDRIKAKIALRLGEGENQQDRFFLVPFAYQNKGNSPEFSHSFTSVIRVLADRKQARLTPGLRRGKFKNRTFEAFTISWLPHDFDTNPNLCVFDGLGSRVDPRKNKCPVSVGKNFKLEETLKLGVNVKNAIGMWGPYEIKKQAFDLAVNRKRLLDGGTIRYRADDRLYRKDRVAINCFHAMAGLEELYPNGGFLGTGFQMWGINGTARVLIEYTKKVRNQGLILEPVDIKKDLYGFVYAPERNSRGLYDPFPRASAYHQ